MTGCSGDPSNCGFCGSTHADCAKTEVSGCSANPGDCAVCKGVGCVAMECTGDVKTCKACKGNFQSCRKAEVTATEGIERSRAAAA
ncbi:hypothetical protein BCR39DRAFT_558547 [Naematelia encephala]|uniref:Uncharacterized protein n=1 Tax=Naematelia encephala TaxID=71784 RepID=A0A1Y2B8Y8_9TREE|nr:hypothetical protein BCR39DRAFT_558547 [Naematelia encephala]